MQGYVLKAYHTDRLKNCIHVEYQNHFLAICNLNPLLVDIIVLI